MNTDFSLETGPQDAGTLCDCCGTRSTTVHGFIYKNGDAFAIYYAGWSSQHPELGVTMAVATGEWDEDSGPESRTSIGLEVHSKATEIQFVIIGADRSPWGDTPLFGKMLSREEALVSPSLRFALNVAEFVVREDPRVRAALEKFSTIR